MPTKDQAVEELKSLHFEVEPELKLVIRFIDAREGDDDEPIKLLEVNAATLATGSVEFFVFGRSARLPYAVAIAEITPEE